MRFFEHVRRFWLQHHGIPGRPVAVAVSGGVDSCLLLEWAAWLREQGDVPAVRVLTVHHHTRAGQDADVALVEQAAARLGVPCTVLHVHREAPEANGEFVLRTARRALLLAELRPAEELWMAHHLDDSWEWAQLQAARSSEPVLGIPLKNGRIWRPFLCVSRAQIEAEAQRRRLQWREDPSNAQENYARAFFRQQLAPALKQQHPQYLKHYARRSQRLAERLGVALRGQQSGQHFSGDAAQLLCGEVSEGQLIEAIKRLSHQGRGTLTREVPKILRARAAGKRGPFTVSGGVQIYAYDQWLLVTGGAFQTPDLPPAHFQFRTWTKAQLQACVQHVLAHGQLRYAPFWLVIDPEQKHRNVLVPSGKDPLWPLLTGQRDVPVMHAQKLLARWKDESLVLRLAPLWPLRPAALRG